MMNSWKNLLVKTDLNILEALEHIDAGAKGLIIVVDNEGKLCGTVSDGDIRRGILSKLPMDSPISRVMNTSPLSLPEGVTEDVALEFMRRSCIDVLPIVDRDGIVTNIQVATKFCETTLENPVVLMAGGLGSRLGELTDNCPKPLLKVGHKPLLENILERFIAQGFKNFIFSVNYLSEQIEEYFGDGSNWKVSISYLREKRRLGTAGALSLLEATPELPFFVMNGDILTKVDFRNMLNFHLESESPATMAVTEYTMEVPYGVVNVDQHKMVAIEEKPKHSFFVNAGIYVLNPESLNAIPRDTFFDMPTLFGSLLGEGKAPCIFPLREYWLDIGHAKDYHQANSDFEAMFE